MSISGTQLLQKQIFRAIIQARGKRAGRKAGKRKRVQIPHEPVAVIGLPYSVRHRKADAATALCVGRRVRQRTVSRNMCPLPVAGMAAMLGRGSPTATPRKTTNENI